MILFWFEDLQSLFEDITMFPSPDMTLEEQMNSVTRLILLIWVCFYILEYPFHHLFLIISIIFIIILYYIQRNMQKETFNETYPLQQWRDIPSNNNLRTTTQSQYRFCNKSENIVTDPSMYSRNHALRGNENPKVHDPVPIIPPMFATDHWSEDYVVPMGVNEQVSRDLYRSGYVGTSRCNDGNICTNNTSKEYFTTGKDTSVYDTHYQYQQPIKRNGDMVENTYQPQQMNNNLPSNYPAGECEQNPVFNEYNDRLFTQTIEPNMFYQTQVIEPIQSNIGISHTQQFQPVTCEKTENGVKYIAHDPRVFQGSPQVYQYEQEPNNSNVYDPRFYGYGTSYRAYVHEMTGQPRYYYDDIDAVRRPNFIARSNIDHAPWADSYGSMNEPRHDSHLAANAQFLQDTLSHRAEMQERLFRKYNTEVSWQRRQAPLSRAQGQK